MSCFMGPNFTCTRNLEGAMVSTTCNEKAEVQELNTRLAKYIQMLQNLKTQGSGSISVSSTQYQEALTMLERELCNLKAMYEAELNKLRCLLEEANRDKNSCAGTLDRNSASYNEMSSKLTIALQSLQKLQDECNRLRITIVEREKENAELRLQIKGYICELDQMKPNYSRICSELESLRVRIESETRGRKDAEDKLAQLLEKFKFEGNVTVQENNDLQARLKIANDICMKLEVKIRQLSQTGGDDLAILLQKLRDANMAELSRYQRETEEALNKTLGTLQCSMSENSREKDLLIQEKSRIEQVVIQLQARINGLEGENQGLKQQVATISASVTNERSTSSATIQALELKIRELEAAMMCSAKEFVNARDAQATLKTEINQYRNILDLGQQKLAQGAQSNNSYEGNISTTVMVGGGSSGYGSGGFVCPPRPTGFNVGDPKVVCLPNSSGPRIMDQGGRNILPLCPPPAKRCGPGPCKCGGTCGGGKGRISVDYQPGAFCGSSEYNNRYRQASANVCTSLPGLGGNGYASFTKTNNQYGNGRPFTSSSRFY